jgi:hypothetical protein
MHKATQTQITDIHASSGIGTHDHTVLAGEDISYLEPRSHRDRLLYIASVLILIVFSFKFVHMITFLPSRVLAEPLRFYRQKE